MDEIIETYADGLSLVLRPSQPNRLGLRFRTPEGVETTNWTTLSQVATTRLWKTVRPYLDNRTEDAALTPQQLADKYTEYMGS